MRGGRRKAVPCGLCNKEDTLNDVPVCNTCRSAWTIGKRTIAMKKDEEKLVKAIVEWYPHMAAHQGDVEGPTDLHWTDIAQAMGAISLRDSGLDWYSGKPREIGDAAHPTFGSKSQELVQVPESRARAMEKILRAFYNGVAKAKAEGIDEGRNLLAGLARGTIKISDFDETAEAARMQRRRKRR